MVQEVIQLTTVDFKETDINQLSWVFCGGQLSKNILSCKSVQPRSPRRRTQHGVSLPCTRLSVCKAGGLPSGYTNKSTQNLMFKAFLRHIFFVSESAYPVSICCTRGNAVFRYTSSLELSSPKTWSK